MKVRRRVGSMRYGSRPRAEHGDRCLDGFERKLQLVGVGYRAQAQGRAVNLSLGFSHPVVYRLPEGIDAETPSQTVVIRGICKQKVSQVSAEIRASVRRSPTRVRVCGTRTSTYVVRKRRKITCLAPQDLGPLDECEISMKPNQKN